MAGSTAARRARGGGGARPADAGVADQYRLWLREMLLIRRFEEKAGEAYSLGKIGGFCHLYIGQEAVAVGSIAALGPDDYIVCSYREHGHALARGIPARAVMAELFGKAAGCSGGKGGSMHLFDASRGFMGGHAIVGGHIPLATGMAFAAKYRGTEQVAVCFFGDGTTNIGAFHEALNFSVVWKLPVIFVCENNLYMEYTPISSVTAVEHPAADRASAYNLEKIVVDGNDADAVYRTATKYLNRARKGGGPALIECMTYRHSGHSRADPAKYRPEGELEKWLERDPVKIYRERLLGLGMVEATLKDIEDEVMQKVNEATETAKASAPPSLDGIHQHVWADGGAAWRN
jgi:pyruvate dehydrogenase E1 component alpha subunit